MRDGRTKVIVKGKGMEQVMEDIQALLALEVVVGFPDFTGEREAAADDAGDQKKDLTNPQLAYIHDNGAPEANIPARPFMEPGIEAVQPELERKLSATMRAVLKGGGMDKVKQGLAQVGLTAALSIRNTINEGIPPPLSDYTLRQRMNNGRKNGGGARKGAQLELVNRKYGMEPSTQLAKPLVDTGQLRNAVTYEIRPKANRSR